MFQALRAAAPFYILYKDEPKLAIGEVVLVTNSVPYQPNLVDIKVRLGDKVITIEKLQADAYIADSIDSGMVVSESKDAIMAEITGFKNSSQRILDDIEKHKHIVAECDNMLAELNPYIKKEAEIENLKKGMSDLQGSITDIKGMLSKMLKQPKE